MQGTELLSCVRRWDAGIPRSGELLTECSAIMRSVQITARQGDFRWGRRERVGCWFPSWPLLLSTRAAAKGTLGSRARSRSISMLIAECYASIDGETWETERRDDGNGNPPDGWPQNIEGHLERLDDKTAVFTSAQIPIQLVFHPAPDAVWTCA